LIAVILFFLLPLITRYFPQHRVLVWAVTAAWFPIWWRC